jgi:ABC-type branched-subunit amino acid transport system permease subunit
MVLMMIVRPQGLVGNMRRVYKFTPPAAEKD